MALAEGSLLGEITHFVPAVLYNAQYPRERSCMISIYTGKFLSYIFNRLFDLLVLIFHCPLTFTIA